MTSERKTAPLILVVEDYDDAREMYVEYLTFTGFRVESATNGLEAIEMTQRLKPDLVLMDLALPKLDGWEATRRLKSDPATARIPVIALTGHALAGHAERAQSPADRRSYRIVLTDAGLEAHAAAGEAFSEADARFIGALATDEEEARAVLRGIGRAATVARERLTADAADQTA